MKILVTGSKKDYWEEIICSGLRSLGYQADFFADDESFQLTYYNWLTSSPLRQKAKSALQNYKKNIGQKLIDKTMDYRPDLIIVMQGDYFLKEDIKKIVDDFKTPVVNWIINDPVLSEFYDPIKIVNLADYTHLFIADELWLPCVYFFEKPVTYLPLAGSPEIFKPLNCGRDIDVFFSANLFPLSPYMTSGLVYARVLSALLREGIKVQAMVENFHKMKKIIPEIKNLALIKKDYSLKKLNEFYNRSKIVLNLFSLDYKKDFTSNIFNTAFSKSFQLAEYKDNGSKLFPSGLVFFKSQTELISQVKNYLNQEQQRSHLADEAYQIAIKNHDWSNRLKQLIHEAS